MEIEPTVLTLEERSTQVKEELSHKISLCIFKTISMKTPIKWRNLMIMMYSNKMERHVSLKIKREQSKELKSSVNQSVTSIYEKLFNKKGYNRKNSQIFVIQKQESLDIHPENIARYAEIYQDQVVLDVEKEYASQNASVSTLKQNVSISKFIIDDLQQKIKIYLIQFRHQKNMWIYLFITLIGMFLVLKIYKNVIKPYKIFNFYKNQFKGKNYRQYIYSFVPYGVPMIIDGINDQKKHKDALFLAKNVGINYDIILSNLAQKVTLVLISPKLIQQFYLLDGTPTYIKQQQFIKPLKRVAKTSITFTEGQPWKAKRRFITSFLNFNYINKQLGTIVNIVNRKLAQSAQGRPQFKIYMLELLQQMTSATIIQLFFGGGSTDAQNLQIQGKKVSSYMRQLIEHIGEQTLDPLSFILGQDFPQKNLRAKDRKVTHQIQKFKEFTKNFIKNRIYEIRQGKSKKQDYVQRIYQTVKQQQRTEQFITNVMFDFSSLYIAGTDTTSHSAMMVLYYIIKHPKVKKRLEEQIQSQIKSEQDLIYQKIKDMIYLQATVYQSLRLYQPANGIFIRQATQDHYLGDLKILKGTLLMTSSMTNHYNPENFQNPLQFMPQRWISQDHTIKTPKPFTWLTFSAGPRSCLGKQLALTQIKVIVVQMIRKYEMELQTTEFQMKMQNLSYQPQKFLTKFIAK